MDDAKRLQLLETEYFKLQDYVESFDERALQIKAWSVTASLAAVVAAYSDDFTNHRAMILWIAGASALAFWIIEFLWKCFQWSFLARIDAIEAAMRADAAAGSLPPLQIRAYWHGAFKGRHAKPLPALAKTLSPRREDHGQVISSLLRGKLFAPAVVLPHGPVAILAASLAILG